MESESIDSKHKITMELVGVDPKLSIKTETGSTNCEPSSSKKEKHQGLKSSCAELDKQVWLWYESSTKSNENLTKCDIQNFARTIYFQANIESFKASDGWYRRWRNRWLKNGSLLETRTELQEKDRDFMEEINFDFPDFDENLFSIGESNLFLEALESLEKEQPKQQTCYELNRARKRSAPAKSKVTVSKKTNPCGKDVRYRPEFKEEVVSFAMNHPFNVSAEKYEIHPTTVSKWTKNNGSTAVKEIGNSEFPSVETEFAEWLKQIRLSGNRISKSDVQEAVTKMKEQLNYNLSKWFSLYYNRLYDGSTCNILYPQIVKTEVVKLAECWSQKYVASILNISRKQIYNWSKALLPENSLTKQSAKKGDIDKDLWEWYVKKEVKPSMKEIWQQASEISRRKGYNFKIGKNWFYKWCATHGVSTNSIVDQELLEWILQKFDQNATPSHQYIRKKCTSLHKNIYGKTSFKASPDWVVRFCKRHSSLLQKAPSLKTVLPEKCQNREKKFRALLKKLISDKAFALDQIGIMDETGLRFLPSTKKGKRSLKSCSFRHIEGSFVLSCTASGNILPLLLILKGPKADPINLDGIFVASQQNGTIDVSIMEFWVDKIWKNHTRSPNVLILDRYQPHIEPSIKENFSASKSFVAPIPAGCGSHFVWVLSEISEFILERVYQTWQHWVKNDADSFWDDSLESSESPGHTEVISWIRKAFEESKVKFQPAVAANFQKLITSE